MPVYIVTAVRFDNRGEVELVRWTRADPAATRDEEIPHAVAVERVVEALDRGDTVMTGFQAARGLTVGCRLARRVLPGGEEVVQDEPGAAGRGLEDLPRL